MLMRLSVCLTMHTGRLPTMLLTIAVDSAVDNCCLTLHTGRLPTTAVDVVYYRYRPVGGKRLSYKEVRWQTAVLCSWTKLTRCSQAT